MIRCKMWKVRQLREKVKKTLQRPSFFVAFWSALNLGIRILLFSLQRSFVCFLSSTNFGDKNGRHLFLFAHNFEFISNSYSVGEDLRSPKFCLPPKNSVLATCLWYTTMASEFEVLLWPAVATIVVVVGSFVVCCGCRTCRQMALPCKPDSVTCSVWNLLLSQLQLSQIESSYLPVAKNLLLPIGRE